MHPYFFLGYYFFLRDNFVACMCTFLKRLAMCETSHFVVPVALIVNTQALGLFSPYKGSSYLKVEVLSSISLWLTLPQLPSAKIQDPEMLPAVDPTDFIAIWLPLNFPNTLWCGFMFLTSLFIETSHLCPFCKFCNCMHMMNMFVVYSEYYQTLEMLLHPALH